MEANSNVLMSQLADRIHKVTNVSQSELRGKCRYVEICDARKLFCYFMLNHVKVHFSLNTIGRWLNKNHATILHNNNVAKSLLETDRKFISLHDHLYLECVDLITIPEVSYFKNIPQL